MTGKSIPETSVSETGRMVRALTEPGEKAPLSSGEEIPRRVVPLQTNEVRGSQPRIQVEPRVIFTRPEP